MTRAHGTIPESLKKLGQTEPFDMDTAVGYILLVGILLSVTLIVSGLVWHLAVLGHLQLEYSIAGMNLFQFVLAEASQLLSGSVHPRVVVSAGIAVLMLTPYVRVFFSTLYFAFVEYDWKYTLFTGFVLAVLTYSLFLR
jgi:uncharacterized membrane protein